MPAAGGGRLVALPLPPGEEFVRELDAAWARGDAVLPLDPAAPAAATEQLLRELDPDEPVPTGTAVCIATSGSTGTPKGVLLSHDALAASAAATSDRLGAAPGDVWLSCLPWHHVAGLQVLLRARASGAGLVVHDRFSVDRVAAERGATLVSLVPTQLRRLLDARVDLSRFRAMLLGGAAAPRRLLDAAAAAGARVVTTYGMTETCGGCVYDGRPLHGVDVRVEADGRILLRGPMLMSGYRGRPDLTAEALVDGWFRTQDVGRLVDGQLLVDGRIDDVVVTGGENVPAASVAALLADHPSVGEVTVVGVPDEEWGQRVVAAVVARGGADVTLEALRDWLRDLAPAAWTPRQLVLLDALPLLASGKPDRARLVALARS